MHIFLKTEGCNILKIELLVPVPESQDNEVEAGPGTGGPARNTRRRRSPQGGLTHFLFRISLVIIAS